MSTQYPDLFLSLSAPFDQTEVKALSKAGQRLLYVTARTTMNRLDKVLGPENWWDEYVPSENSVLCRLTIRLPDGTTLTKSDAGGYAGMADQGDDDKSGYSDAFKRAAVKFGVARYLYRDGTPAYGDEPAGATAPHDAAGTPPQSEPAGLPREPNGGRGLFAAVKDLEAKHSVSLVKPLNDWARREMRWGDERMVDWSAAQVHEAWQWVASKLAAPPPDPESSPAPSTNGVDLHVLRQRLFQACRAAAAKVYANPDPTDFQVKSELLLIGESYSPGLVVDSIKTLSDVAELAGLIAAAGRRLDEVSAEIPF